jgi:hypothetical protein
MLDGNFSPTRVARESTRNPMDAKLHLYRLSEKALPFQELSQTMKPIVMTNGAAKAAATPDPNDMTVVDALSVSSHLWN